jgi:surface protein
MKLILRLKHYFLITTFGLSFILAGCNSDSNKEGSSINNATAVSEEFISSWKIPSDDLYLTLPLRDGYNYNFTVDWGDGETSKVLNFYDSNKHHFYRKEGIYKIKIKGLVESWDLGSSSYRSRIVGVDLFSDLGWINLESAFSGCTNLEYFKQGSSKNVINMKAMFAMSRKIGLIDLSGFNTSNTTNMEGVFYDTSNLNTLDLSSFNTSNVTSMREMFRGAYGLKALDISNFNTSSVIRMGSMFYGAYNLKTLDLSNFDTSNVIYMDRMFYETHRLESVNLTGFDISSARYTGLVFGPGPPAKIFCNDQDNVPSGTGVPSTGTIFGYPCN